MEGKGRVGAAAMRWGRGREGGIARRRREWMGVGGIDGHENLGREGGRRFGRDGAAAE